MGDEQHPAHGENENDEERTENVPQGVLVGSVDSVKDGTFWPDGHLGNIVVAVAVVDSLAAVAAGHFAG